MESTNSPFSGLSVGEGSQVEIELSKEEIAVAAQHPAGDDFADYIRSINGIRALKIWEVVSLSLGLIPNLENLRLARQDKDFSSAYTRRKLTLERKLSKLPALGKVTLLAGHPARTSDVPRNALVDAVSALEVLRNHYAYFPVDLRIFETSVKGQNLSSDWLETGRVLSNDASEKVSAKDTVSSRQINFERELLATFIESKYGKITPTSKQDIVKKIKLEIGEAFVSDRMIKTMLSEALAAKEKKSKSL